MVINSFTLLDAVNQFWKLCEGGDRRSLTSAGLTYFYLCNVWNTCGRPISFRRQNTLFCAELEMSKPTLERHRNILKQAGLIDFFSKGKGDPNITYKIIEVKNFYYKEVKKENIITTPVTSDVTTPDDYKQSKSIEKDIFILIAGEVKNFSYLKDLFDNDFGLKTHWSNQGFAAEKFLNGFQLWMIQNYGANYDDYDKARKHFLYWIPKYAIEIEKHLKKDEGGNTNERTTKRPVAGKSAGANELLEMFEQNLRTQQRGE